MTVIIIHVVLVSLDKIGTLKVARDYLVFFYSTEYFTSFRTIRMLKGHHRYKVNPHLPQS